MRGISVVIPNYNGLSLLPGVIPPLKTALNNSGLPWEIIIPDDASTDGSVKWIQDNHPDIELIQSSENLGFSPTINKGIFKAKHSFILLLNSDVKLRENYFEHLLPYFDDPLCFGVMGKIINWDDEGVQDGGKYPYFHGVKIKTSGNYLPIERNKNELFYSMYLSGANALVDREKILQLGGFDELFAPFYVEDFELSLRAWRMGWTLYFEPRAICRHKVSVSIKSANKKKYVRTIYYRNKMYLHAIHLPAGLRTLWFMQLLPELLIRIFTGRFYYLKSLQMFFNNREAVRISRQKLEAVSKGSLLSVKEVTNKIRRSLSGVKMKKF